MKRGAKAESIDPVEMCGQFICWTDGGSYYEVIPDPPSEAEAKPFHVSLHGKGWVPLSLLVFARDAEHAKRRVHLALKEIDEQQYESPHYEDRRTRMAKVLLDGIEKGEYLRERGEFTDRREEKEPMRFDAVPIDVRRIVASVNWATNGGVL